MKTNTLRSFAAIITLLITMILGINVNAQSGKQLRVKGTSVPMMSDKQVEAKMAECPYKDANDPRRSLWRSLNCSSKKAPAATEALEDGILVLSGEDPLTNVRSANILDAMGELIQMKLPLIDQDSNPAKLAMEDMKAMEVASAALRKYQPADARPAPRGTRQPDSVSPPKSSATAPSPPTPTKPKVNRTPPPVLVPAT
jgi:hypothetical protein